MKIQAITSPLIGILTASCVLLIGCSGEDSSSDRNEGSDQDIASDQEEVTALMQENLSGCELWEEGKLSSSFQTNYIDGCLAECFAEHDDCDTSRLHFCENDTAFSEETPLALCIQSCNYFDCDDTTIYSHMVCDGELDCMDGTDEAHCPPPWKCTDGTELDTEKRCDGTIDCTMGEDEEDCDEVFFTCDDGEEIPPDEVCNLHVNCADGSDEEQGCARPVCEED